MNIPEIKALKQELEEALTKAFSDFHALTGVQVERVEVARRVRISPIAGVAREVSIGSVNVTLENL
jgi:hypothetical protein